MAQRPAADQTDLLAAVQGARDATLAAEQRLAQRVIDARHGGCSWQQIGDVLGVSRQAAFKRFGRPTDPETGRPMTLAHDVDVRALLRGTITRLAAGDPHWARERMTYACARELTARRLHDVWRDVLATVGELERFGADEVREPDGRTLIAAIDDLPDPARAPVPCTVHAICHHEAGELVTHLAVNRDGKIAGILVGPPGAEQAWPF